MVGRTSPPLWDPGLTWPLLGLKSGEPWFPLLVMAFSSEPGAIPESQQRTGRGQAGTGSKSTAALVWKRWVRTWWSSDVSIIIRNSSHQAVFVLNCHLPHQDCPCPPSLFADSLRIWAILMPQDGVQISVSLLGTLLSSCLWKPASSITNPLVQFSPISLCSHKIRDHFTCKTLYCSSIQSKVSKNFTHDTWRMTDTWRVTNTWHVMHDGHVSRV